MTTSGTRSPCFILSTARSGSTLLRYVLDAHPEVACPPELNLCFAFRAIDFAAQGVYEHEESRRIAMSDTLCRELAESTIGSYARERGKLIWCEKSLPSVDHTTLLLRVYPEARFICLYRECTDTIASLLEATPWGYGMFGIEQYVRMFPDNLILALGRYWYEKTAAMQAFADEHPQSCFRLRYEDLVLDPTGVAQAMFKDFLGVRWDDEYVHPERVFEKERHTVMPGDFKIRYTSTFSTTSIGHGRDLPLEMLPPPLREQINELQRLLGYAVLDPDTPSSPRPLALTTTGEEISSVEQLFNERVASGVKREASAAGPTNGDHPARLKIVLRDLPSPWVVDYMTGTVVAEDGDATRILATDSATLLAIANGRLNAGVALMRSAVKVFATDDSSNPRRDQWVCLDALVRLVSPASEGACYELAPS